MPVPLRGSTSRPSSLRSGPGRHRRCTGLSLSDKVAYDRRAHLDVYARVAGSGAPAAEARHSNLSVSAGDRDEERAAAVAGQEL